MSNPTPNPPSEAVKEAMFWHEQEKSDWPAMSEVTVRHFHVLAAEVHRLRALLAEKDEALVKYRTALDAMWGVSQDIRDAIIKHFGILHPPAALSARPAGGEAVKPAALAPEEKP